MRAAGAKDHEAAVSDATATGISARAIGECSNALSVSPEATEGRVNPQNLRNTNKPRVLRSDSDLRLLPQTASRTSRKAGAGQLSPLSSARVVERILPAYLDTRRTIDAVRRLIAAIREKDTESGNLTLAEEVR